uniref:TSA: Wollemia nobilis Ref_Wollemi_Transcript_11863_2004 transcribed RNA sequence n=1 Tax=Wollemia nobilis TaxID=56998 RepID=A0A0C9RLV7_9CONI
MTVHAMLSSLGTTLPGCLSTLHKNSPTFKSCHPQFTITDLCTSMGCSTGLSHSPRFGFSSSRVLPTYDFRARNITRIPHGRPYPMAGSQAREGPMSNSIVEEVLNTATSQYPVYMAIGGFIACTKPSAFAWFVKRAPASYILSLGIVMLAMGLKLELQDLINVLLRRPFAVLFGCFAQYSIMPLTGTIVSRALGLSPEFSVGLILLSCCPVGSASSVVTLIAKGDVPLSIVTTVCSTLAAVFITPLLTKFLAGAYVPVDAGNLAFSTLQVVVVPVLAGLPTEYLSSSC